MEIFTEEKSYVSKEVGFGLCYIEKKYDYKLKSIDVLFDKKKKKIIKELNLLRDNRLKLIEVGYFENQMTQLKTEINHLYEDLLKLIDMHHKESLTQIELKYEETTMFLKKIFVNKQNE